MPQADLDAGSVNYLQIETFSFNNQSVISPNIRSMNNILDLVVDVTT